MQLQILEMLITDNTFTNVFTETAMGTSLQSLDESEQQKYLEAVHRMGEIIVYR